MNSVAKVHIHIYSNFVLWPKPRFILWPKPILSYIIPKSNIERKQKEVATIVSYISHHHISYICSILIRGGKVGRPASVIIISIIILHFELLN
jgi:hypothetical protein